MRVFSTVLMLTSLLTNKLTNSQPSDSPLLANAPRWGSTTCQMPDKCLEHDLASMTVS